jgi:predicted phosphoribosyltransferase
LALFRDRSAAGRELAGQLAHHAGERDVVVLGLPRGGLPVALEVAEALDAPLDVFVVRKLGVPGHEELAMGAVASGGTRVLNSEVIASAGVPDEAIEETSRREREEVERRERAYRGDREPLDPAGKTTILVDDGLATGSTMRAAVQALRERGAGRIVVAVPVSSPEVCARFESEVDEVVCARTPEPFYAVGTWYDRFPQVSDEEVSELLGRDGEADELGGDGEASELSAEALQGERDWFVSVDALPGPGDSDGGGAD